MFLKAKNNHRLKFCLLVANHGGYLFQGADEWAKAAEGWLPYFKHSQHVTVDGKPLVIIFNPRNGDQDGFAQVQAAARKAGLPGVAIAGCGSGDVKLGFTHRTHYNIVPGYASGSEEHKFAVVKEITEMYRKDHPVLDVDGARIDFGDGWGLVRASNTTPLLVLRFEADSEERLAEIRGDVEGKVQEVMSAVGAA